MKRWLQQRREHGSLIILTMIIIFAMSSIGLSVASVVLTKYNSSRKNLYVENALTAAEAGLSATLQQLNKATTFTGYADTNRQVLYDNTTQGRADYSTTISDNADGTKTVISTGYVYRPGETSAYNSKRIKAVVKGVGTSVPAGMVTGPGGLLVSAGAVTAKNIYVNGQISLTGGNLGAGGFVLTPTDVNVNVANVGCGSGASYPTACSGEPISFAWNTYIYGTVCATGQTTVGGINNGVSGLGLRPNCTSPVVPTPVYDRSGMYDAMFAANGTKTAASIGTCGPFGGTVTMAKDQIYTGNITLSGNSCIGLIKGNFYLTGDLNMTFFSNLRVDNALTTPPIILVDGNVTFNGAGLQKNASGIGAIVISFKSADATCDHSCNSISATNLYNSINTTTALCSGGFCGMDGSVIYAYFGRARVTGSGSVSGIAGQRVWVDSLSTILSDGVDKDGLQNDDAFNGAAKITNWKTVDYQQLYP